MIIGISGQKHSGKTTWMNEFARQLAKLNKEYVSYSFADPVKQCCAIMEGVDLQLYYTDEGKKGMTKFGITRRELMTKFGTDFAWTLSPSIWVDASETFIGDRNVIIGDVRTQLEADYIIEHGGIVIRLIGDPDNLENGLNSDHISETDLNAYLKFTAVYRTDSIPKTEIPYIINRIITNNTLI